MVDKLKLKLKTLSITYLTVFLVACGPSDSLKDEAYNAGWQSAWNERCRGIDPPLMMPSKYDDSRNSGELVYSYRAGIVGAKASGDLCD